MFAWLSANLGTILVLAIVVAIAAGAAAVLRRDKKNGKSSCGGNCAACGLCHNGSAEKK